MSFGKKFGPNKSPISDREMDMKYKMFEKLSQKGFLQQMQQQMRRAIAQELNDSKDKESEVKSSSPDESKPEATVDRNWDSLAKVSSIANWEKQIRFELEIDREIQTRELDRQRDRLTNEWRKLTERDKCLRIELDARERKIRIREEELQTNVEELNQKSSELAAKEETINCIVNEKIKSEMKDEIEKLKKKFNELEVNKLGLIRREEKVKEVEQRLHEQVKIVKEKIDNKRLSEIELAKSRKDLEIIRKENEVLKQRVDSMEDYPLTKFENKSLKSELNAIKETLKNKLFEFESERERLEKVIKQSDEKVLTLTIDLRKCDQELLLMKQKHQGVIDEYEAKLEQIESQFRQSKSVAQQLQLKNHLLAKEIVSNENETQKLIQSKQISNNNLPQSDGQKFGCYICDHNIKTVEESTLEYMISQKCGFDSNQPLEPNLDLHSIRSSGVPFTTNADVCSSKGREPMQNSVPLSPTTPAIKQNTSNTCAKHKQNGIYSMQTIEDRETADGDIEDMKTSDNTMHYNNVNKHKFEDKDKDNDISDAFDW